MDVSDQFLLMKLKAMGFQSARIKVVSGILLKKRRDDALTMREMDLLDYAVKLVKLCSEDSSRCTVVDFAKPAP